MKAMLLQGIEDLNRNHSPLSLADIPQPQPKESEVLIKVSVCGVCHTELDEIEGRTPPESYPMVPGHQVVGTVEERGRGVDQFDEGDRVGVAWIYSACGECYHCKEGEENLCKQFTATGRDKNGGYAEYMTVPADFAYAIPNELNDEEAAPLLCAGAIGYRSLSLTNLKDGKRLGLTGFGASGHLVLRMVKYLYPKSEIYVFARNPNEREFALELGAVWAGDTEETAPEPLHAIIDTTPVWKPDVEALRNLAPGGRLVINAIRKENSDIYYLEKIDYSTHLWMEKEIKSVANVTRNDVQMMLKIAAEAGIKPDVQLFPLEEANEAIMEIKQGKIKGGKVLTIQ
ncbi:MAG: zinc-dependent alcohol dehydrogenase family protein [Balneolaceae bacterium]|nr:zinc-dependent alcohol dehydrogenase family protein [Balneolaceae bacterium]